MWHASVCVRDQDGVPKRITDLCELSLSDLRREARKLLRGVGIGDDIWESGDIAMHLRRRVHPREMPHQAVDVRRSESDW